VSALYHARLIFLVALVAFAAVYAWMHLARRDD
jgi:hypothetical protein